MSKKLYGSEDEPTVQELVEACADLAKMATMEEALGYAFTLLIESGVEDPESFLISKGILRKP